MATERLPIRVGLLLLATALLVDPAAAGVREWTNSGPFGGRPRTVVFHPADPEIAYAGGAAGLYVTTDGGASWRVVPVVSPNEVVSELAISERPPYSLFVLVTRGFTSGRLLQLNPDLTCCAAPPRFLVYPGPMAIVRGDPEVLLVNHDGASLLRKPLDATSPWQTVTLPWQPRFLEAAADWSGHVFATSYFSRDGLRSSDRGATWTPMPLPMAASSLNHVKDGIVYLTGMGAGGLCAGSANGLFQSWDYGATWFLAHVGLSANDRDCYESTEWVDCVLSGTCYLGTTAGTVFSREEGEVRWVARPDLPFSRMWVRPDGRLLLGGGASSFSRSVGGPWGDASRGLTEVSIRGILVDEAGEVRFAWAYSPTGASPLFERRGPQDWVPRPFAIDPDALPAVSGGHVLARKHNGEWQLLGPGASAWSGVPGTSAFLALSRGPEGILYGFSPDGARFRFQSSENGGKSWKTVSTLTPKTVASPHRSGIYADPVDAGHVLLRSHHDVLESTDGGKSWKEIRAGSALDQLVVDWRGAKVYAVDQYKLHSRPFQGGEWTLLASNVSGVAVEPSTGALYAAAAGGGVLRSDDGGATWVTFDPARVVSSLVTTATGIAHASPTGVWEYDFPASRRRAVRK